MDFLTIFSAITIGILLVGVVLYIKGLYKKSIEAIGVGMKLILGPAVVAPVALAEFLRPQWLNLQPVWKVIAIFGNILWVFFFIFILGPRWRKKIEQKFSDS